MTRTVRWLLVIVVVPASAGAGVGAWLLTRGTDEGLPQISVYSHGHSIRVGPYFYCNVINLDDCQNPQTQGELPGDKRYPVQLSVPTSIGRAPWRLLQIYENENDSTDTIIRPNTLLAMTIPTVDAKRGRLTGIVVQLLTMVRDPKGELHEAAHAEWSVRVLWN